LQNIASLESDGLDVVFSRQVNNLDRYFLLLSDFGQLDVLNIDVSECTSLNDSDLEALSFSLSQMKRLKSLNIRFPKISKMQDFALDSLMNAISCLSLESLSLDPPFGITQAGLESIILSIKKLESLTSLCLDLSQTRTFDDLTLDLLTNSLQNLKYLQLLSLNLSDSPNLSESTPLHTFFTSLQSNLDLYSLQLIINNTPVLAPAHIKTLSSTIMALKDLKNLGLSF
jgi:hypothetical protein